MSWNFGADERAALQFDDLASALDAGLPVASLGGDASLGDEVVVSILQQRGLRLSASEHAVMIAAWRSGKIGECLRSRAQQRRQRAEFARRVWAGVRYPLLVLTVAVITSLLSMRVTGSATVAVWVCAGAGAMVIAALVIVRGMRHGGDGWFQLPLLGPLGNDLGELPYLETLHALYGAGVALPAAHEAAVAAVPFAATQRRLAVAGRALQEGRRLAEGLAEGAALHAETRSLLTTGEGAGQLEEALHRALVRRRTVAAARAERLARLIGSAIYAIAVTVVIVVVVTFYSNLFALTRR